MMGNYLFISYANEDEVVTERIVAYLEARGVQCWIASRNIPPRAVYAEAITQAIREASACAVIVSRTANESKAIKRELELASHADKPFIPIRIDRTEPGPGLDYYLRNIQWIDYDRHQDRALDRIVSHMQGHELSAQTPPSHASPPVSSQARTPLLLALVGAILLSVIGVSAWLATSPNQNAVQSEEPESSSPELGATLPNEDSVAIAAPSTPSLSTNPRSSESPSQPPATQSVASGAFRDCSICPEMIRIPSGSFMRDGQRRAVRAFAAGLYEVTQAEWEAFAQDTGRTTRSIGADPRFPAGALNWPEAKEYVAWLSQRTGNSYRLLTRDEWEYANRGKTQAGANEPTYWWGDSITAQNANYRASQPIGPRPVGSYEANGFGLYDTVGNTWEWLEDCQRFEDDGCAARMVGGGSWLNDSDYLPSAFIGSNPPLERYTNIGLRVARDVGR